MKKIVSHNQNGNKVTLKIYVSPQNISKGIPLRGESCAIALALGCKKGLAEVVLDEIKLVMRNPVSHRRMTYTGIPTKKMQNFIYAFDFAVDDSTRKHMRPREFTVRLSANTKGVVTDART